MNRVIPFATRLPASDQQAWLAALQQSLPETYTVLPIAALTPQQQIEAEVAIVANPNPADLMALPNLKWVQSLWAGVEALVVDTQGASFALVRMTDPQLAKTMAEAVLAWTLYLHRDMPRYRMQQTARLWQPHPCRLPQDRTVGILGLGKLGTAAAQTLSQQGFRVCGWKRSPANITGVTTFHGPSGLFDMLQQTHILVCLLPLTPSTYGLLNRQTLGMLTKGAALINFGRGPIVDTDALIDLLNQGQLSHGVLDVFNEEPLPPQSPLWTHPSITVLPHISALTHKPTAAKIVADNITEFFQTGKIPASVDRQLGY